MRIQTCPYGPLESNVYLLHFDKDVLMVDAGASYRDVKISPDCVRGILCTHYHFDHIFAINEWERICDCPIYFYHAEIPLLKSGTRLPGIPVIQPERSVTELADRQILGKKEFPFLGDCYTIEVLHTPGHTPGSVCFFVKEKKDGKRTYYLFSGDTLFAGDVGRTDLGGSMSDMKVSVALLKTLPDSTAVFPGHGESTTIGREKERNPYFT